MAKESEHLEEQEATLGQRIKARREALGMSQDALGEKVGVSWLTVLRWEKDRSYPRGDDVQIALIEVLDLPKNEFTKEKRKKRAKQNKEISPVEKVEQDEEILPVEEVKQDKEILLVYEYRPSGSLPSLDDFEGQEVVEYKIPPVIVYRGFYEQVFDEKYGPFVTRKITTNGKVLLPYDTWARTAYSSYSSIFSWGRQAGGEGSRNLAQAILLDYFENMYPETREEELRTWVHNYDGDFKREFVLKFDSTSWEIWSGAITAWLREQKETHFERDEYGYKIYPAHWVPWLRRWDKYKST